MATTKRLTEAQREIGTSHEILEQYEYILIISHSPLATTRNSRITRDELVPDCLDILVLAFNDPWVATTMIIIA